MNILGFDIGGTKCAVILGKWNDGNIGICSKNVLPNDLSVSPFKIIDKLCEFADLMLDGINPDAIGVSCGGPLDSTLGVIKEPPNLPGWKDINIVEILQKRYGVPAHLQNDANACAVAEWKFGAGKGFKNIVFLTFGTGLGAGLILDGHLYAGTNDMGGEVGHIRLDTFGPVGFGKRGSFEGFCSGNGIAQLGYTMANEQVQSGNRPLYFPIGAKAEDITAKSIAEAAYAGDSTAIEVYKTCGEYLGKGLAVIIDILNPEKIIIGSIFSRSHDLLWASAKKVIDKEALPQAASCCQVTPAVLGESIGDYAALATALL